MASDSKMAALRAYDESYSLRAQMEDMEPSVSGEFLIGTDPENMVYYLLPIQYHDPVGVRASVTVIDFDTEVRIVLSIQGRGFGILNKKLPLYSVWNDVDEESEDDTSFLRWIRKL